MDWFWRWGGECFGYRRNDRLFTYHGIQVGKFYGAKIYGADGRYLGEVKSNNRLITHIAKKGRTKFSFVPVQGGSYARYANCAGFAMYIAYEDFPSPDDF